MKLPVLALLWLFEPASTPSVQDLVDSAEVHFRAGRYDEASRELERAHALDPQPHLLFGRSVAERHAGRCEIALALLRRFLASDPSPDDEAEAHREMKACGVESADASPRTPSEEAAPSSPAVVQPVSPDPAPMVAPESQPAEQANAWYREPWGGAMVALGGVGIGLGSGFAAQATADARRAENASHADAYLERMRRARVYEAVAITGFSVGGALVLAGVVRWVVVARRGRTRKTASGFSLDPFGSGLALRARF